MYIVAEGGLIITERVNWKAKGREQEGKRKGTTSSIVAAGAPHA